MEVRRFMKTFILSWISNDNNGSGDDVINLIRLAQKLHKFLFFKCIPEIIIVK